MTDQERLPPKTLAHLAGTFGAPLPEVPARGLTLEDVRAFLAPRIAALLDRQPALLMSILYRIDVPEHQVKAALGTAAPDALPGLLADLIIERQLLKLRIRRAYRDDQ